MRGVLPDSRAQSAARARAARSYAGMTQRQLAALARVDLAQLKAIESGRAPLPDDLAERLAAATRAPMAFLREGWDRAG